MHQIFLQTPLVYSNIIDIVKINCSCSLSISMIRVNISFTARLYQDSAFWYLRVWKQFNIDALRYHIADTLISYPTHVTLIWQLANLDMVPFIMLSNNIISAVLNLIIHSVSQKQPECSSTELDIWSDFMFIVVILRCSSSSTTDIGKGWLLCLK